MNTAHEINFLDTSLPSEESNKFESIGRWIDSIPLRFGKNSNMEANLASMLAVDGGFVFERESSLSLPALPSGLTSGIIGMTAFVLIGGLVASETLSTTLLAKAMEAARSSLASTANQSAYESTSQASLSSRENKMSAKKIQPATSSSTIGSSTVEAKQSPKQPALTREVFGFLPYWFVDEAAQNLDYSLLSTLAYFDIPMNADGSLDTLSNGWQKLHTDTTQEILNQAKAQNTRVVLTYTAFDSQHIESIATNEQARNSAVTNMVNFAKSQGAQGANIDFEYVGEPEAVVREGFTQFVQQATERFHTEIPGSQVTVSMYAVSAKMERLYQVDRLADISDGLFIMAYDFYTAGSSNAGPVAPLTGAPGTYWYDVTSAVNDFVAAGVPENKMILGVPYYGYDWPTVDHSPKSAVLPGSKNTANYSGVQRALAAGQGERRWDYEAQVPYFVYEEDGVSRIAYYDDAESLAKKYDLVNSRNLKGAGIWALGQDGDHHELWDLLRNKFIHE